MKDNPFGGLYYSDGSGIYSKRIHPEDEAVLDSLTSPKNWDFKNFKQVLLCLALVSKENKTSYYIPAYNMPQSIHFGSLRKYINELSGLSKTSGHELCRTFLVDSQAKAVVAGKKTEGKFNSVHQDWSTSDEKIGLSRCFSIHTHPASAGFSDADYLTFMSDPQQQGMFMVLGETTFIILKSTGTPNVMSPVDIDRRIKKLHEEHSLNDHFDIQTIINFNKSACLEFGISLFIAKNGSDLAERINVVK